MLAFAARYGHQPLNVIMRLPFKDLLAFTRALSSLLEEERGNSWQENLISGGS